MEESALRLLRCILCVLLTHLTVAAIPAYAADQQGATPVFSATGPDAADYGESQGYPVGSPLLRQRYMVGDYTHFDSLHPSHLIAKSENSSALERAPTELRVTYRYHGQELTIGEYLARNPTTGLLIARDNTILFEHYQYGRTDQDRFMSDSMAKTFVSMLVGIAVDEHKIRSIDDSVETYVPALQHTAMGAVSIRALLHMASGIAFEQSYSGSDDDAIFHRLLFSPTGPGPIATVKQFNRRIAEPNAVFSYASLDTEVLGLVLTHATGMGLSEYLRTRVWEPMGAEADARWITDNTGQEIASCCLDATLRDYARFGLLLAHYGCVQRATDYSAPMGAGCHQAGHSGFAPRAGQRRSAGRLRISGLAAARIAPSVRAGGYPWTTHLYRP
jgi:CubicO group peptidase (beta-lactamase class C family)